MLKEKKLYNEAAYLRQENYPFFWALKFMPSTIQSVIAPFFYLSTEMKRIPITTTTLPGYMRLTWWRTQIQALPSSIDLHPLFQYLSAIPQAKSLALINSYEQLLEDIPFKDIKDIILFAKRSDGQLLTTAHFQLTKAPPSQAELDILEQAGICMTCCYLIQARPHLEAKGHHFASINNDRLLLLLQSSVPRHYTKATGWLAPLNGYYKAVLSAYSRSKKPQLITIQWRMITSYLYHILSFLRS
jgi:hypothetical protein